MGRGSVPPVCILSPTAEWPDSTACGCTPQQPGDCQAAASQGELPTQLGLGKSELGFPGDEVCVQRLPVWAQHCSSTLALRECIRE